MPLRGDRGKIRSSTYIENFLQDEIDPSTDAVILLLRNADGMGHFVLAVKARNRRGHHRSGVEWAIVDPATDRRLRVKAMDEVAAEMQVAESGRRQADRSC